MNQPPKYAQKFLSWFLKEELAEEVMGDLEEKFEENLKHKTLFKAKVNYWYQTLNYLRPFAIKNNIITSLNPFFMWQHNLKITFRKFQRNKTTFGINLIGLSTGLACALLIFFWVQDELSMDKFHEKEAQLYKVLQNRQLPQKIITRENTPLLLGPTIANQFSEIASALTISSKEERPTGILAQAAQKIAVEGLYAGANFFEVLSFKLIHGQKETILKQKNDIAISKTLAFKLFNTTENLIGKTIHWSNPWMKADFQITGIYEMPTANSIRPFDFVLNLEHLLADEHAKKWNGDYGETYVVLKAGTDIKAFNQQIAPFLHDKAAGRERSTLFLQQFSQKYLYGNYENGQIAGGRIDYVRLFSLISIFILLIACINFMNLSTAQAATKMKEVGIKKAIGARRKSLVLQFLGESILMAFIAFGVALLIVQLVLPQFNEITNKSLELNFSLLSFLSILSIVLLTGLIAGSYAAFYLSRFSPIAVLKGKINRSIGEQSIRKGLVIFQFSLSVIFIVGVCVVHQQMDYIQTKKLGFNRENVLSFERPNFRDKPELFLTKLKAISGVSEASGMFNNILSGNYGQSGYSWRGEIADEDFSFKSPIISYGVIEMLGMELLAGRTYSRDFKEEASKIVMNESALKMMGLTDPIGKRIGYGEDEREIIGVVRDFNYGTIHHQVEPLIFRFSPVGNNIMVKLESGTTSTTIEAIENVFTEFHPAYPFSFTFLDTDYQALYESEETVATLSKYFSGLAILISCLGLLGLAMFTIERRKKEIGIRKVLGASVIGIMQLLTKDFTKTIIVAILIAIPISYWMANQWLGNFAYTFDLTVWLFVLPSLFVLLLAWMTVGLQTLKTANLNPTEALKSE